VGQLASFHGGTDLARDRDEHGLHFTTIGRRCTGTR
jgi:hypothetical protein